MCKVISVVNQKGGVGKTTTTVNVGIGLAREGKKVLLIDADPQGSLTASLGYEEPDDLRITLATIMMDVINEEEISLEDGILHHQENVDLLPANIELSALEVTMGNVMSREMIMKEYIDAIRCRYDYILIDCMPSLGMMTINALVSSDSVLIPVQAAYLPVKGLQQLIKTILTVKKRLNRKLAIEGILLTMVDFRTNYARDIASRVHTVEVTPEEKVSGYRKKLHRHEKIPDDDNNLNSQKKSIRKKQLQKQMTKEQAKAGRLSFDDEGNQMVKGAGMKPGGTAGKYIATQAVISGMKAVTSEEEETDENAGVESARLAERETEAALRGLRHAQIRSKRTDVKTHRRGYREATVEKKLKFGSAESMEGVKHAESVKNAEQKRHFYNRFFQKKRYKDAYRAARAGKSAGSLGGATTIAGVENMTVKAKIALKEIIKRNRAMFAGIGIFALLFLVIAVSLGSCSASIEGAGSVIGITTYPSSDEDIYAAENRYAALESALNQQINEMERRHPNYDEYQYNIAEIGHNPYHLISYLTAKYGDWTYSDVESELQSLFEAQYHLNTEGRTETVTETRNVRVGESLGQVVTSGYCNCRICCGVWSGGPTASGAYPTANHTIAVDASNPFVPIGTKVVMNGVEYTVEDTGAFARYGVQFDVYYDNHAAASAHGHQTWEAYIADDNGSQEVTVTSTSTKKILYVTLTNGSFDAVARANLNAEQLIIYNALNTTYGNRNYLWDVNNVTSGSGGNGMSYEIPPEALQDEEFARMIREAEKYLGVPYVWGGYSPSGFDCSGFVSYVINHCGNGWNYGRLTADGLRGVCTYVSPGEAKPGDLIFFQGTYNTSGASHVGIYVGNNMMIHCGDPIHYSNISTSYWQQHFMCFGRLP